MKLSNSMIHTIILLLDQDWWNIVTMCLDFAFF